MLMNRDIELWNETYFQLAGHFSNVLFYGPSHYMVVRTFRETISIVGYAAVVVNSVIEHFEFSENQYHYFLLREGTQN